MRIKTLQMKKTAFAVLIGLLLSVAGVTKAFAQTFTVGNLNYSVNDDGVSVTVTGHVDGQNATGELIIPESVEYEGNSYSVTIIRYNAFNGCSYLTGDLVIPNSVTTISDGAFDNCSGFSTLTIGTGLRRWDTWIGFYYDNSPFYNCTGITTINYNATYYDGMLCVYSDEGDCYNMQSIFSTCTSLTTINIGENVQSIPTAAFKHTNVNTVNYNATNCNSMGGYYCTEQYAFEACEQLTTINIGENVQTIPSNAFRGCSSLTSVVFSESITTIGESAFYGCSGLTGALNIPNSVTTIGNNAFNGCSGLTSVLFPESITTIGESAFYGCSGLTGELTIPEAVTFIGGLAFAGTGFTSLVFNAVDCGSIGGSFSYNGTWGYYSNLIGMNITSLIIGENVHAIPEGFFASYNQYDVDIVIPNSVISIGNRAFWKCSGIQSLTIGSSVTTIGEYAFYECTGLNSITFGAAVTTIGDFAFQNCTGLSGSLIIPETITYIGNQAFNNCSGFTGELTIPENVSYIGGGAFILCGFTTLNYNAIDCELDFGYGSVIIDDWRSICCFSPFACGEQLTTLNIGNQVQRIPYEAFENRTYSDDSFVFVSNSFSGQLIIPESVIIIEDNAFSGCEGFVGDLVIPDDVTYIGSGAFEGCSGFGGTLTIGASVSEIGGIAFYDTQFESLNYNATNCISIGAGTNSYNPDDYASVFIGIPYVNIGENVESIPAHAFNQCQFDEIIFPNGLGSIDEKAFMNCINLTCNLVLPNSLTTIGDQAFYNCYGLEGIVMGNAVETIGAEAFRNCGGLRGELTLPETLQSVGNYAFASCDELTTINYNAVNCTAMGNAQQPVFYDCASMAHIKIGENVESIPNYAFKRCSTVTDMTVAATVPPTVGSSTFGTLQRSIPVTVQCEATAAYQAAQYWNEFTNYNEGFNYVLEVTCDPERGTVVVNKMADCDDPTARVTAYPEMGYAFLGWSENGTLVSEANPYTFTMESSRELQAEFIPGVSYSVTVSVVPAAAGTVTGQGNYNDGSAVTLTATTNPGYAFVNWTENGSVVSTDEEYTFTIHANRNLVANFTPYAYHWDVNIHQYPGNMTAIGVIQIDGVEQTTPTLEIGAFCNDECRGRQLLTYYPQVDRYMVFLMLYGEDGDEMSFKLYDHILEQELTLSCTSLVTFAANTALGNPVNPYVFNFINSQQTPLAEGWTWYSTYIEQEDVEGLQMMTEALNESGVMIKSQTGFIANSGGQWMGNLDEITNESMYMVNTTAATLLDMVGNSAIASQHPITMNSGWNWIGYPMATANSVSVALSDLVAQPNDVLKSQESFATYYEGMGWFGSLNTITPGMGLMYDSKNDAPVTFTYTEGRSGELKRNVTAESNHWVPDMHKYTNNMNVMAVVELDDVELRDSGYELAVFAGNECRGSVRLVNVEPVDRYVAFLTVAGREATDLQFVLFDADENREYGNAKESLVFESDAVVGSTKSMMTVHFASCEQENDWSKIAVYPNPADGGEYFSIVLPAASDQKVRVEIINELGAVVSVAQSSSLPMEMKAPATPGLYTLKIVAEGNAVCFCKLVVK